MSDKQEVCFCLNFDLLTLVLFPTGIQELIAFPINTEDLRLIVYFSIPISSALQLHKISCKLLILRLYILRRHPLSNLFILITLQVVSTRYDGNKTTLKVNGEKYYIHGTQEKLVYDFDDLLIAVGGFLGLFIGLSLNDVMSFLVDLVVSLEKRYSV